MLADAGLAIGDMAVVLGVGVAFLAAILWAEKPTVWRSVVPGLCTAVACLSKFTALGYIPVAGGTGTGLLFSGNCWSGWRGLWVLAKPRIVPFALAVSVTAFFIWGRATGFPLGQAGCTAMPMVGCRPRSSSTAYAKPSPIIAKDTASFSQFGWQGWWYYFPVVLAFKTWIAFMILLALGTFVCLKKRASPSYWCAFAGVLLPAMNGRVDIKGVRHVEWLISVLPSSRPRLKQLLQLARSGRLSGYRCRSGGMARDFGGHPSPRLLGLCQWLRRQAARKYIGRFKLRLGTGSTPLQALCSVLGVQEASMSDLNGIDRWETLQSWHGLLPMERSKSPCSGAGLEYCGHDGVEKSLDYGRSPNGTTVGPTRPGTN